VIATAADYPNIAAIGAELFSGTASERLDWGVRALIRGIAGTPAFEDRATADWPLRSPSSSGCGLHVQTH